jgi:CRP-like cAMP-binding protein
LNVKTPKGHPLFGRVSGELWQQTLEQSELLQVDKGGTVYQPKRFRRCLGMVLQGRVQVRREALLMSTLSAGDIFGAAALFTDREHYPTTLTALTPCQALLIPQDSVRRLLRESPPFAEDYAAYLSSRIQFLSARLEAVSTPSAHGKLARYLLAAGDDTLTLSATQLCQRLGVGRATLYRAFEVLEESGAIVRSGKTIRIADRAALSQSTNEMEGKEV